jgi:hypothetical protein
MEEKRKEPILVPPSSSLLRKYGGHPGFVGHKHTHTHTHTHTRQILFQYLTPIIPMCGSVKTSYFTDENAAPKLK